METVGFRNRPHQTFVEAGEEKERRKKREGRRKRGGRAQEGEGRNRKKIEEKGEERCRTKEPGLGWEKA